MKLVLVLIALSLGCSVKQTSMEPKECIEDGTGLTCETPIKINLFCSGNHIRERWIATQFRADESTDKECFDSTISLR